ncbi:MAG TPA: WbqC family protein [Bacteroidales bacterium]|nr:WbqC family protein [Bacteroidales bacterium]
MPSLFPTAFLPPVQYMAESARSDTLVIEDFETYRKQTCRNHCEIAGPNGRQILTVPVTKPEGNHTRTRDIRILYDQPWHILHWRSIETAYNNSPFFLFYQDAFRPLFEKRFTFLIDLNQAGMEIILPILNLRVPIAHTLRYEAIPDGSSDLRQKLGTKHSSASYHFPKYSQVFFPKHPFHPGLSILDTIFNLGPETKEYLNSVR